MSLQKQIGSTLVEGFYKTFPEIFMNLWIILGID